MGNATLTVDEYKELYSNTIKLDILIGFYKRHGYVSNEIMKSLFDVEYKEQED